MATKPAQLAQQTIASTGTAQVLTNSTVICYSVLIRANSSNVGYIVIGNSGVTTANSAIQLVPNDTHLFDKVDPNLGYDLSTIWVAGTTADKFMVSYTIRE